jgi:hypothetical protein
VSPALISIRRGEKDKRQSCIKYHTQDLEIAREVVDLSREVMVYGNLGCVFDMQGDFSKDMEYHTKCLAITKKVGYLPVEHHVYNNLCTCT